MTQKHGRRNRHTTPKLSPTTSRCYLVRSTPLPSSSTTLSTRVRSRGSCRCRTSPHHTIDSRPCLLNFILNCRQSDADISHNQCRGRGGERPVSPLLRSASGHRTKSSCSHIGGTSNGYGDRHFNCSAIITLSICSPMLPSSIQQLGYDTINFLCYYLLCRTWNSLILACPWSSNSLHTHLIIYNNYVMRQILVMYKL